MTVQPLPTRVALAVSPEALGVLDVPPETLTVLLLKAVVPFVPSSAAKRISILSTEA